jgi:LPS-assembly lipoprotein
MGPVHRRIELGRVAGPVRRRIALGRVAGLVLLPLAASALVSGCGFRLRTSTQLPFRRLYTNFPRNSAIGSEFRALLRTTGDTAVVDKPEQADAQLLVLREAREREVVGFTSTGRPREYQLRLRLRFRVLDERGREWLEPTELLLRREITSSEIEMVTRQQEEEMLYREMQSDAVQLMLRRLMALKPR